MKKRYLAVDPGTTESAYLLLADGKAVEFGQIDNDAMLEKLESFTDGDIVLALEMVEPRGMPIGNDTLHTILWTGRFLQCWHAPDEVQLVRRREVKSFLCSSQKATDSNIRQALIDMLGEPGTKKNPGPTYGISKDIWAALAVAVTARAEEDAF